MVGFSWEQFKVDLDELVVVECVYCGELMICFIDWLFIDFQCYEEEQFSWLQEGVIFDGGGQWEQWFEFIWEGCFLGFVELFCNCYIVIMLMGVEQCCWLGGVRCECILLVFYVVFQSCYYVRLLVCFLVEVFYLEKLKI